MIDRFLMRCFSLYYKFKENCFVLLPDPDLPIWLALAAKSGKMTELALSARRRTLGQPRNLGSCECINTFSLCHFHFHRSTWTPSEKKAFKIIAKNC
jgi:hypothetical protein